MIELDVISCSERLFVEKLHQFLHFSSSRRAPLHLQVPPPSIDNLNINILVESMADTNMPSDELTGAVVDVELSVSDPIQAAINSGVLREEHAS